MPQEEEVGDPAYHFPSIQDEYHAGIATTTREEIEQMIGTELPEQEQAPSTSQATDPRPEGLIPSVIKTEPGEDVKPTLRMMVLSQRRLLQWQGTGDEELIITKVTKGNDPLADFYDNAEATQEIIEVEETDSEDNLSEVSMQSNGDVNKAELRAVLQGLTNSPPGHGQSSQHPQYHGDGDERRTGRRDGSESGDRTGRSSGMATHC